MSEMEKPHRVEFAKATGLGNDFIIIDNRDERLATDPGQLAATMCDRHFGVGADGLLILKKSARADFLMEYYNADGSTGGMCGNGGRSLALFAHARGVAGRIQTFEALGHIYRAEVTVKGGVRLRMKPPTDFRVEAGVQVLGEAVDGFFVDTGSPHFVTFCEDIERIDVEGLGRRLRKHERFQPGGANVNFVRTLGKNELVLRTYERGVEAETLACGTGSVAAALIARDQCGIIPPVTVRVQSGDKLIVHLLDSGEIWLEGGVRILFDGICLYDSDSNRIYDSYTE